MVKITTVYQNTWIVLGFVVCTDSSFYFKYFKEII